MKFTRYLPIALILSHLSFAETTPGLDESIQRRVAELESALSIPNQAAPLEERWYLQNIWLRSRLPVGFSLPGFVSLMVVPEIEFLIQREIPEGWKLYHP